VLLLGASVLASVFAYAVGYALGPGPLSARLAAASPGERVPAPLSIQATGVYLSWPVGAMAGLWLAALRRPSPPSGGSVAVDGTRQRVHNHPQ
jgi:hypothetical protein